MSVTVLPGTIIYQCSLCIPLDVGCYWLYAPHRGPICQVHGPALHYEYLTTISYIDSGLFERLLTDVEVDAMTATFRQPFQPEERP